MTTAGFTIRRNGREPLSCDPASLVVDAATFGVPDAERSGQFRLVVPDGWRVTPSGLLAWQITPERVDVDRDHSLTLKRENGGSWTLPVPVRLDLRSTFDPILHTFPEPNRASVLGDILPERSIFEATYTRLPAVFGRRLFTGLYSDIVFLRKDGPTRGGLCSGMARWSIARSLGDEPEPASREDALRRITTYHGRQLCDRSFLLGIPTFLRGSPAASYRAVRRDLLRTGTTGRAFDVAVPKPWRRDIVSALVSSGHTIVPYRILQSDPGRAEVEVYDPNRPPATLDTPGVVEFDLVRDHYAYLHRVSLDQSDAGLVAARQTGYSRPGTAIAAALVSMAIRVMSILSTSQKQQDPEGVPSGP